MRVGGGTLEEYAAAAFALADTQLWGNLRFESVSMGSVGLGGARCLCVALADRNARRVQGNLRGEAGGGGSARRGRGAGGNVALDLEVVLR